MSAIITPYGRSLRFTWDCDDERDGFEFEVQHAPDQDLYLRILPKKTNPMLDHFLMCPSAILRIRIPLIGGGRHEHLYDGLSKAMRAERKEQKK